MKRKRKLRNIAFKQSITGLLFVTPWIAGFLIFFLYPLYQSVIYSFNKVKMTGKRRDLIFIGLENYKYFVSKDPYFIERLMEFLKGIVLELPLILVFSLVLALLLNEKVKLKGMFRTLFFLPIIVVSGPVMSMLLNEGSSTIPLIEQYGIYELISASLPIFLSEPISNVFSQLILILWYSGVPILIFFSGLQKIDSSLYEASSIDGASSWISFWKIVLPSIRGMILINAIYIVVFLATSEINEVIIWIRESMTDATNRGYGVAAAAAWIYSISIALLLLICYLLFGKEKKSKEKHAQIIRRREY